MDSSKNLEDGTTTLIKKIKEFSFVKSGDEACIYAKTSGRVVVFVELYGDATLQP